MARRKDVICWVVVAALLAAWIGARQGLGRGPAQAGDNAGQPGTIRADLALPPPPDLPF